MHPACDYRCVSEKIHEGANNITYASLAHTEAGTKGIAGSTVDLEEVCELNGSLDWGSLATRDEDLNLGEIQSLGVGRVLSLTADLGDEEVGAESVGDAETAAPFEEVAGLLNNSSGGDVILATSEGLE